MRADKLHIKCEVCAGTGSVSVELSPSQKTDKKRKLAQKLSKQGVGARRGAKALGYKSTYSWRYLLKGRSGK